MRCVQKGLLALPTGSDPPCGMNVVLIGCLLPLAKGLLLREPLLDAAALLRSGEPSALRSLETALAAAAPGELLNKAP